MVPTMNCPYALVTIMHWSLKKTAIILQIRFQVHFWTEIENFHTSFRTDLILWQLWKRLGTCLMFHWVSCIHALFKITKNEHHWDFNFPNFLLKMLLRLWSAMFSQTILVHCMPYGDLNLYILPGFEIIGFVCVWSCMHPKSYFEIDFWRMKNFLLINFLWSLFLGIWLAIGILRFTDNGLVSNRWQATTWTNAERFHWCIYASRGLSVLSIY